MKQDTKGIAESDNCGQKRILNQQERTQVVYGTANNSEQKKEDTACSQCQGITGVQVYKEIAYGTAQKAEKDAKVSETGGFFQSKVFKNRIKKKTQSADS